MSNPTPDTLQVEIWSDIACPWCYVGKRRFEAALDGFAHRDAVTVTWRSFELDPNAPRTHHEPALQLLARKYGVSVPQAQAMNQRLTETAAGEGLVFRLEDVRVGNTFDAHRLLHSAAEHGLREAMSERLFAAYLSEGAALGDADTLVRLAVEVGLDDADTRRMLESDRYADAVRADEAEAAALGVTGVPMFVLNRRYGVSGAQPASVLQSALQQAWDAREEEA
jgi:predicted DsbA family dithiol-disulfide isomerase